MDFSPGRRSALLFLLLCAFIAPWPVIGAQAAPASQAINLCEDSTLTTSRRFTATLTLPAGEYSADCGLLIVEDVTVSIPSGVTIRFGEGGSLQAEGRLEVLGSAPGDVTFTSDAPVQAQGQWRGLEVDSVGSASISGLELSYGGRSGSAMINAKGPISMTNVTVRDGEGQGIWLNGVDASLSNVTVRNQVGLGVQVDANRDRQVTVSLRDSSIEDVGDAAVQLAPEVQLDIANNQVRNAGLHGVALRSGTSDEPMTFRGGDMPYVVEGALRMKAPLSIEAGTIVKFQDGAQIQTSDGGGIDVAGTEEAPVYFTTITDDAACLFAGDADERIDCDTGNDGNKAQEPGAWQRVHVDEGSLPGAIRHAILRYGDEGALSFEVPGYTVENATVEQSRRVGIFVNNPDGDKEGPFLTVRDTEIRGSGEVGLRADLRGYAELVLENNRFVDNAIAVDADADLELIVSGNSSEGDGLNGYRLIGDMSRAHTWRANDLPFVLGDSIELLNAATVLTIEPGAVVKAQKGGGINVERGRLLVGSVDGDAVLITSVLDDACSATEDAGCDTNGDEGQSEGRAGDWRGIVIPDGSLGAVIENTDIRFSGVESQPQVRIESSDVELRGNIIHHGAGPGIGIELAQPLIENNDIHTNGIGGTNGAGLRIESGQLELQVSFANNRIYNNSGGAVEIDANVELELDGTNSTDEPAGFDADPRQVQLNGIVVAGTISQNIVWRAGDLPFVLQKQVTVDSQSTLTLEPGLLVKFDEGGQLSLRSGTIEAVGNEGEPIILTSVADPTGGETKRDAGSPRKGDWPGLVFGKPGVAGRAVRLENVEIRYAGAGDDPAVTIQQDDVEIVSTTILEASGDGVLIDDAEGVVIRDSVFEEILGDGLNVETNQGLSIEVRDNRFTACDNAVHVEGDVQLLSSGNEASGNGLNGVLVSGKITKIRTWAAGDLIWALDERVEIDRGTLTIEAGAVVKGTLDASFQVSEGRLTVGSDEGPTVVITSIADDTCGALAPDDTCDTDGVDQDPLPGDWDGLDFGKDADAVTLRNTHVRYAGGEGTSAAVDAQGTRSIVVSSSTIEDSESGGLRIQESENVQIRDSSFLNNRESGVYLGRDTSARIQANTFIGNARPLEIHTRLDVETADNVSVGNVNDAMLFSEDVTKSQSWTNDFVRDIDQSVSVDADLTIEPGSLLRFDENAGIEVLGTLNARGVVFTADEFDAENGHWSGVSFEGSAEGGVRHSTFAFGGSTRGALDLSVNGTIPVQYNYFLRSDRGAISAVGDRINPLIKGNVIRGVAGTSASAIRVQGQARDGGARVEISNNFIADVRNGIEIERKNAQLLFNHLAGVADFGILNKTNNVCVDGRENWWGDPKGPEDDHDDAGDCGEALNTSDGSKVSRSVKWMAPLEEAPPALPILDLPRNGTTNQSEVAIAGRAGAGDELLIYDADASDPIGRVDVASDGRFETTVNLSPGVHELSVATVKEIENVGPPVESARLGFRLVDVDPSSVIDPVTVGFVYGNRSAPQVQPLRDVTGAAPACGGSSPGRVVLPAGSEVVVRLKAAGGPGSVEFVQGDRQEELRLAGSGYYESDPFVPEQGQFALRADGDDAAACRGFVFLGGAGTVFADVGAPANPILVSDFEDRSNDGWIRDQPWAIIDDTASTGSWSVAYRDYEPNADASVTLAAAVDLSQLEAPEIHFDQRFDLGRGDKILVEIQTVPDGRWSLVDEERGSRLAWHGKTVSLDEYAQERRVRLRFRLDANTDDEVGQGWWLDDVRIQSGGANNDRLDAGEPVIAGAQVLLSQLNPETGNMEVWDGRATGQFNPQTTDASGRFAFFALPPGEYRLQIIPPEGSGLQPFTSNPPFVVVDGTLAIDVPLSEAGAIYLPIVRKTTLR